MSLSNLDKKTDRNPENILRTGNMDRSTTAYLISGGGIFLSFLIMSIVSEKSVKVKINGEKFAFPEVRLIIGYLFSFIAATTMRFITKEKISFTKLLHPIYKNENYIISSILLFFCNILYFKHYFN